MKKYWINFLTGINASAIVGIMLCLVVLGLSLYGDNATDTQWSEGHTMILKGCVALAVLAFITEGLLKIKK